MLERSQKTVMVPYCNNGQMRESGFITNYIFVLVAGAKAKTVTSLFTLLTVLAVRANFSSHVVRSFYFNSLFFKSWWEGL
jgi:hypothetical protein